MRKRGLELVTIRHLKKNYDRFPVLRGLHMHIDKGDVYGFLGRNGCGKTTTMNIIANVIPKDSGDVILGDGEPVKIGYLPESPTIFGYMTAREYLEYIAGCCQYEGDVNARVNEVLDIVGLTSAADRRAKGYSRGMTQRLGMGAAIFANPQLLLFDEPTSALDPQGRAEVIEIINRLKSLGATIILSTHILPDVERVANKIGIMNNGIIAEEGTLFENAFSCQPVCGPMRACLQSGVYVTQNGKKYHRENCMYVAGRDCSALTIEQAEKEYEPCKVCNP